MAAVKLVWEKGGLMFSKFVQGISGMLIFFGTKKKQNVAMEAQVHTDG